MDQSNEQEEKITHFLFADNCHFVARNIKVLATINVRGSNEGTNGEWTRMQEGRNGGHQASISMVLPAFCSTICTCGRGNTCSTGALTAFSTSRACWISFVVVPWAASTSRWPPASRERQGNSCTCAGSPPSLLSPACRCSHHGRPKRQAPALSHLQLGNEFRHRTQAGTHSGTTETKEDTSAPSLSINIFCEVPV